MSTQPILVCQTFQTDAQGVVTCSASTWVDSYVFPPDTAASIDLLLGGGFSEEAFALGFAALMLMFAIGFGIGLVISQMRRLRRGV